MTDQTTKPEAPKLHDWQREAIELLDRHHGGGSVSFSIGAGKTAAVLDTLTSGIRPTIRPAGLMLHGYVIRFPSMFLGGTAMVLAYNEVDAAGLLLREIEAQGLPEIKVSQMTITEVPLMRGVPYFYNGDY